MASSCSCFSLGHVPVDVPDDDLILVVAVEAAEVHAAQVDNGHVVPSLCLVVSTSTAYRIIRRLNDDLKKSGKITIAGKISTKYFYENIYM